MNNADVTTLLKDVAPEPGPEDFAKLETIVRGGHRRRVRHALGRTAAGVVVLVTVVAGGLALSALHAPVSHSRAAGTPSSRFISLPPPRASGVIPGDGRPIIELFDPSQDLLQGGQVVSVAEAARQVAYQLYLPNDAALPVPEVWIVREIGEDGNPFYDAAVRYDSSVILTYGVWTNGRDPAAEYKKMQADWNAGYVTTIAGNPAWVVPAGSPHTVDPRISVVDVSIGDVEMKLLGRVSVEDLIAYASTLEPTRL
jgi:hypothetical protein